MAGPRLSVRRIMCVTAAAGVPLTTAVLVGTVTAGAVVVVGALGWGLVRWPRWEARAFRPGDGAGTAVAELGSAREPSVRGAGLGPDGHRAFAQALHAVTAAYLAECEREAER